MASIVIGVTPSKKITTVRKVGEGAFQQETLSDAIQMGTEIGFALNNSLMKKLKEEEKIETSNKVGFLG